MNSRDRTQVIVRASWIGIVANGILAIVKLIVGFYGRSAAVISDGVDSTIDVLTSAISVIAAKITAKPPDLHHPYGHTRAETIATKTLSFIIFFAGAQLAVSTAGGLIRGETRAMPASITLWVTGVSIVIKLALTIYKFAAGRRANSPMLIADAKNMRADIAVSLGVLIGLGFTFLLGLPVIDAITALVISAWIMYVAFRIFLETNSELMEGYEDTEIYRKIFDAVDSVPGAHHPHRTRIRTVGIHQIVDLDIEVDGTLSVREAHRIAVQAEGAIRDCMDHVYDVLVHVEPLGNVEESEKYGVSRRKLGRNQVGSDPGGDARDGMTHA